MTLVSIVTPSYNCGRYIEQTILSILRQDYHAIEHIIVDGGSNDNTIDILNRYKKYVSWISEPDNGMYDAINKGFALAGGDILTYINADDFYYSRDTIKKIVKAFKINSNVDFVYGHCAFTDSNGRLLYVYKAPQFNSRLALAYPRILFHQPTCFWKRDVHKGFDDSLHHCADSKYFRLLCAHNHGINIGRIIANFRVRNDCWSFVDKERMAEEDALVFGPIDQRKVTFFYWVIDLFYIRAFLNLKANLKRLLLHYQKRPYL